MAGPRSPGKGRDFVPRYRHGPNRSQEYRVQRRETELIPHIPFTFPVPSGNCLVCGDALSGAITNCRQCETPHHKDCWDYNHGCAVYACNTKITSKNKSNLKWESESIIERPLLVTGGLSFIGFVIILFLWADFPGILLAMLANVFLVH